MAKIKYTIFNATEDVSQVTDVLVSEVNVGNKYTIVLNNTDLFNYFAKDGDTLSDVTDGLASEVKSERSLRVNYTRKSPNELRFESEFEGQSFDIEVRGKGINARTVQESETSKPVDLPDNWFNGDTIEPGGSREGIFESERIEQKDEAPLESLMDRGLIEIDREAHESDAGEETDAFDQSEAKMVFFDSVNVPFTASNVQEAIEQVQGSNVSQEPERETFIVGASNQTQYNLSFDPVDSTLDVYLNGVHLDRSTGDDYTLSGNTIDMVHPIMPGDQIKAVYTRS
jgi:hypothetical protein